MTRRVDWVSPSFGAASFRQPCGAWVETQTVRPPVSGSGAAAQALGLGAETGRIAPGLSADLAIWNAADPAELVNPMGFNPLHTRYFKGRTV